MVNRKHVFWQALLSAVLIFGVGILIGIGFENSRNDLVEETLVNSEINLLDSQLLGTISNNFEIGCEDANLALMKFADRIYNEARILEDYDEASQLTGLLEILHKRYDLLRVMLWAQAIDLKKNCGSDIHTVVYIFQYKDEGATLKSEQLVFSRKLESLKNEHPGEVILIPIAGNLELESVELIKKKYLIDKYPAIIVDEKHVIKNVEDLEGIEEVLFS